MKLKKKQTLKKFTFYNVITLNYWLVFLLCIPIVSPIVILYSIYLFPYFKLYGLVAMVVFILFIGTTAFSFFRKTVEITFDTKNKIVYIKTGKKEKQYSTTDFIGFYSHDYERRYSAIVPKDEYLVSFIFKFKNGKQLELADIAYSNEGYEEAKSVILKRFLRTAKRELGFEETRRSKFRSIVKIGGAVWYSKPEGTNNEI
ncbi:hypothetical protein AAG747_25380 [Rapidithrix thailandica]|uniref:Transmembrane protein n=1 Tax=Rapidithrix thailandica TaxID=413964 RepID=A0AAW9S7U9_9BACT